MNWIRKIAPYLLLSIFSLTTLHAVVPHTHHVHHDAAHDHKDTDHDSHGHHHHSDAHEHQSLEIEDSNAIEFLLEFHAHSSEPQLSFTHSEVVFAKKIDKDVQKYIRYHYEHSVLAKIPQQEIRVPVGATPFLRNPYLSAISLRGPPDFS